MLVRKVISTDLILKYHRIKPMERLVLIVCDYVAYINVKITIVSNKLIASIHSWYGTILLTIHRCYKAILSDTTCQNLEEMFSTTVLVSALHAGFMEVASNVISDEDEEVQVVGAAEGWSFFSLSV